MVDGTDASEAAVFGPETGDGLPAPGGYALGYALPTSCCGFEFPRKDARHPRPGGCPEIGGNSGLEPGGGQRGNVRDDGSERRLDLRLRVTW